MRKILWILLLVFSISLISFGSEPSFGTAKYDSVLTSSMNKYEMSAKVDESDGAAELNDAPGIGLNGQWYFNSITHRFQWVWFGMERNPLLDQPIKRIQVLKSPQSRIPRIQSVSLEYLPIEEIDNDPLIMQPAPAPEPCTLLVLPLVVFLRKLGRAQAH